MLDFPQLDFVFMTISIDGNVAGKWVVELLKGVCPKTCENFKELCVGGHTSTSGQNLHYKDSIIHRIVSGGWIQGGDVIEGSGARSESVYGKDFPDETFSVRHDQRGIVGMANKGIHTNGSQFYVTLKPAPWMNNTFVAFGRIVEGSSVLSKLEDLSTKNERPTLSVKIIDCGIYKPE
eukprot:m.62946 g.62946  ORF g.62946 m.62946 type:complete len:178 (+) comp35123_c0_seq17:512-1045(+)